MEARALGTFLLVGIYDDASISRARGQNLPASRLRSQEFRRENADSESLSEVTAVLEQVRTRESCSLKEPRQVMNLNERVLNLGCEGLTGHATDKFSGQGHRGHKQASRGQVQDATRRELNHRSRSMDFICSDKESMLPVETPCAPSPPRLKSKGLRHNYAATEASSCFEVPRKIETG